MSHEMGPDEFLLADEGDEETTRRLKEIVNFELSWGQIFRAAGRKYKKRSTGRVYALCAFHNEKTRSMVGYPETNTYICYGCGSQGDKFEFLCAHFGSVTSERALRRLILRFPPEPNIYQLPLPNF